MNFGPYNTARGLNMRIAMATTFMPARVSGKLS
jgi:hypothetical protein